MLGILTKKEGRANYLDLTCIVLLFFHLYFIIKEATNFFYVLFPSLFILSAYNVFPTVVILFSLPFKMPLQHFKVNLI